MADYVVKITETALIHLCMMGLESYCVPAQFRETYGLLWGSTNRDTNGTTYYRVEHVLTDAEAIRGRHAVEYNEDNIRLKVELMKSHWQDVVFIGDIHTHPYEDRPDARGGWRLSDVDRRDVEEKNTHFWREVNLRVNLVLSIHRMGNAGWAPPGMVGNYGYTAQWSLTNEEEYFRLRLAAYVVNRLGANGEAPLYLRPRHRTPRWDNSWTDNLTLPNHEVRLEIPSVLGITA